MNLCSNSVQKMVGLSFARFQILPEERTLTAKFGQACQDYFAGVRRGL